LEFIFIFFHTAVLSASIVSFNREGIAMLLADRIMDCRGLPLVGFVAGFVSSTVTANAINI
jgi:uncharacterized membrane protein (DUF4010 family)